MTVYLIHFDRPYKHARHYLGYADNLAQRLHAHQSGNGARLMEVIALAGIGWQIVRTWRGDRVLERRLKNWHNSPDLCPICNPDTWHHYANFDDEVPANDQSTIPF